MKKIVFNDKFALTEAVLEGRKTMTRRILDYEKYKKTWDDMCRLGTPCFDTFDDFLIKRKAYYKVGEVVAVAQSYKSVFEESLNYAIPSYHWLDDIIDEKGYANKMFVKADLMPHQIKITDIKVERLQDISDEDCMREGVLWDYSDQTPRLAFASLINRVSGKSTWEMNPWVWVYEFQLIK